MEAYNCKPLITRSELEAKKVGRITYEELEWSILEGKTAQEILDSVGCKPECYSYKFSSLDSKPVGNGESYLKSNVNCPFYQAAIDEEGTMPECGIIEWIGAIDCLMKGFGKKIPVRD